MLPEHQQRVSHRDHPLRKIQSSFEESIPGIINLLYNHGLFDNTQIDRVLRQSNDLHPDDITLAGLQITIEASAALASGISPKPLGRLLLGNALDIADGALARHLGLASPEGAIKDVIADRVGDNFVAKLIANYRQQYDSANPHLEEQLQASFQYSTLTKAASEMTAVHTSEGGQGSMLERRRILLFTLFNLGRLNYRAYSENLFMKVERGLRSFNHDDSAENRLTQAIDQRMNYLIQGSHIRAKDRATTISRDPSFRKYGWGNPELTDSRSPAAIEARKYTAVVLMNERMGLDIVGLLNTLCDGLEFPTAKSLMISYPYISESLRSIDSFTDQAVDIARSN